MFGIRLLPRIRNWKDLILYRPRARVRYAHIDALFRDTVDWKLIRRHWKDWMQLVLSVQAGKVSSSTLIRQLSHRNQVNPLARFADELGKVERTVFLLNWISDLTMRQQVTAMTNKVEGYHGFSKWLSFGGEVIAENDPEEQQKHIRYNDLLASAVILQNVIDMSRILHDLRGEGWTITDEDLSFPEPLFADGKTVRRVSTRSGAGSGSENPRDSVAPEEHAAAVSAGHRKRSMTRARRRFDRDAVR
jgi:TnpA family transposase